MRTSVLIPTIAMIAFLMIALPVRGDTWAIDPVHSTLSFKIRHLYSDFYGRFNSFSGTITGDLEDPASIVLAARADMSSIDTGNVNRDKHLRNADFFDTAKFPAATFTSSRIVVSENDKVTMYGKLTFRGITMNIKADGAVLGKGIDHRGGERLGVKGITTIDRGSFNMNYNSTLKNGITVLGTKVEITFSIEAIKVKDGAAPSLDAQLKALKATQARKAPPGVSDLKAKALTDIAAQQSVDGLKIGTAAPDFSLPDARGNTITLSEQLKKGPVVLIFYRGEWCPFCNLQLRALEKAYPAIQKNGASVLAISPQKTEKSALLRDKAAIDFPLLGDAAGDTMRAYKLLYKVPQELRKHYENVGINLDEYNGEGRWELPVTATYIVGTDGRIKAALVDKDYTKRMEPLAIINVLKQIQTK